MNLVGQKVIDAYRVSQTHPKSPAIERYMDNKLCASAYDSFDFRLKVVTAVAANKELMEKL